MSLAEKLNRVKQEKIFEKQAEKKQTEEEKKQAEKEAQEEINKKMAVLTTKRQELEGKLADLENDYGEGAREKADWKGKNEKVSEIFTDNKDILKDQGVKYSGDLFKNEDFSEEEEVSGANEAAGKVHERISGIKAKKQEIKEMGGLEKENITKQEAENILKEKIAEIDRESQELYQQSPEYKEKIKKEILEAVSENHENFNIAIEYTSPGEVVGEKDLALAEKYGQEETKQVLKEYWGKVGADQIDRGSKYYYYKEALEGTKASLEAFPEAEESLKTYKAAKEDFIKKFPRINPEEWLSYNAFIFSNNWENDKKLAGNKDPKEIIMEKETLDPYGNIEKKFPDFRGYKEYYDRSAIILNRLCQECDSENDFEPGRNGISKAIEITKAEAGGAIKNQNIDFNSHNVYKDVKELGLAKMEEGLLKDQEKKDKAKELTDVLVDAGWEGNYHGSKEMVAVLKEVGSLNLRKMGFEEGRARAKEALLSLIANEDKFAALTDVEIDSKKGDYSISGNFSQELLENEKEGRALDKEREEVEEQLRQNNLKGNGFWGLKSGQVSRERKELTDKKQDIEERLKENYDEYQTKYKALTEKRSDINTLNQIMHSILSLHQEYTTNGYKKTIGEQVASMKEELAKLETTGLSAEEEETLNKYQQRKKEVDEIEARIKELKKELQAE